jgi:hypothetical protein
VNASTPEVKLDALQQFVDLVGEPLADVALVQQARSVAERASDRLRFPKQFTTVALAGTTGSGKSSMFNAFTTIDRSPVGILRPTTSEPYACVWGNLFLADELLDWLGVSARRRFTRESALDANDEVPLRGMILLDLPDIDSVEQKHRVVVDRLLHLVDVVVWICDPQKYADQLVHEGYLRQLAAHRSGLIVALNQTDKLLPAHLPKVGADLRQLLDEGGLKDVPLVATSATAKVPEMPATKRGPIKPKPGPFETERAVNGFPGVATLRAVLEPIVQSGRAGMESVDRDVTAVLGQLSTLVGGPASQPPSAELVDALVRRRVEVGIREYATAAAKSLPETWHAGVHAAATTRRDELEAALEKATDAAEASRPKRVWLPGGRNRADARMETQLRHEVEKVALRYVIEPVRRVLATYERARKALS